ncbi:MAG: hypothetical protein R2713_11875 [Ilumatobacteraceae bacterium]
MSDTTLPRRVASLLDDVRGRLRVAWAAETAQWLAPAVAATAFVLVLSARSSRSPGSSGPHSPSPWSLRWPRGGVGRSRPHPRSGRGARRQVGACAAATSSPRRCSSPATPTGFARRISERADHLAAGARASMRSRGAPGPTASRWPPCWHRPRWCSR